jgi:hypothetical protein
MGVSVHLLCAFEVAFVRDSPRSFLARAEYHLGRIHALPEDDRDTDAIAMLEAIVNGHGPTYGRNGDMFTWGCVGNYSDWSSFLSRLTPFFVDCWNTGHLSRSSHVIILEQGQDQVHVKAIEVRLSPHAGDALTHDDLMIYVRDLGMPIFKDFEAVPAIYRAPRLDRDPTRHHPDKEK